MQKPFLPPGASTRPTAVRYRLASVVGHSSLEIISSRPSRWLASTVMRAWSSGQRAVQLRALSSHENVRGADYYTQEELFDDGQQTLASCSNCGSTAWLERWRSSRLLLPEIARDRPSALVADHRLTNVRRRDDRQRTAKSNGMDSPSPRHLSARLKMRTTVNDERESTYEAYAHWGRLGQERVSDPRR